MATTTPSLNPELVDALKRLRLGRIALSLSERLVLAEKQDMAFDDLLLMILTDEISRRDSTAADNRASEAGLDPSMRLELWDKTSKVSFDKRLLSELVSLRFLQAHRHIVILGPVGVGKTHLATALGHMAIRRRHTVSFARADKLFTRLRAARLDNTVDTEIRRLAAIDVLIIDDFALRPLDATETSDFYEIVVERHRAKTTIVTSNREPAEWLTMTADTLLAQSAIDRLTATAHTLVIEGPSYRQRTRRPA